MTTQPQGIAMARKKEIRRIYSGKSRRVRMQGGTTPPKVAQKAHDKTNEIRKPNKERLTPKKVHGKTNETRKLNKEKNNAKENLTN